MKILLLHGLEGKPGGRKSRFLCDQGATVVDPHLPKDDWEGSVAIARQAYQREHPDVVVGSSRGGAVALAMGPLDVPLVLIAPAWRWYAATPPAGSRLTILHSAHDTIVPLADSQELVLLAGLRDECLRIVGTDHGMNDAAALSSLWEAVSCAAAGRDR